MRLTRAQVSAGTADLGDWGTITVTGAASAVVNARHAADIDLPSAVAEGLVDAALLLNEEAGRLLVLPFAGEVVACVELGEMEQQYRLVHVPRDPDVGMRVAHFQPIDGVTLFMTERSLMSFDDDFRLAWRVDEDFSGWEFGAVEDELVRLVSSDWSGNQYHQVRSLRDGSQRD